MPKDRDRSSSHSISWSPTNSGTDLLRKENAELKKILKVTNSKLVDEIAQLKNERGQKKTIAPEQECSLIQPPDEIIRNEVAETGMETDGNKNTVVNSEDIESFTTVK